MSERVWTVEEAAEELGVSTATVRRWAATKRIRAKKVGSQWLIGSLEAPTQTESGYVEVARELLDRLEYIRATGYADKEAIQEALTLHAKLAPVYFAFYGHFPVVSTSYPPRIWWRRAYDNVSQALAALEGGLLDVDVLSQESIRASRRPAEPREEIGRAHV